MGSCNPHIRTHIYAKDHLLHETDANAHIHTYSLNGTYKCLQVMFLMDTHISAEDHMPPIHLSKITCTQSTLISYRYTKMTVELIKTADNHIGLSRQKKVICRVIGRIHTYTQVHPNTKLPRPFTRSP